MLVAFYLALVGTAIAAAELKATAQPTGRSVRTDDSIFNFLTQNTAPVETPTDGTRRLQDGLTAGTETLTGALTDTGCFETRADGGWGFCGDLSCKDTYVTTTGPTTISGEAGSYATLQDKNSAANPNDAQYTSQTAQPYLVRTAEADNTNFAPGGPCDNTCTQVTTGVCSAAFLAGMVKGDGIKYAYCNDKWLVIESDGTPSHLPNMNDTPFPPAGSCSSEQQVAGSGANCRTGMDTLDTTKKDTLLYPLTVTELSASAPSNNIGVFECGGNGDSADSALTNFDGSACGQPRTHLWSSATGDMGIPADAGIGMTVSGQSIFPVYNNGAGYTPDKCEVDSCQEHVGQGGGQPHFHGDPFSATGKCMYGPSDYAGGTTGHPPLIGFSFDGMLIYGRYLNSSAPGFAAPLLDSCGGHVHTTAGIDENGFDLTQYHYHTQVFDVTCPANSMCVEGNTYTVSTSGAYKCYKADLSAQEGSSALLTASSDTGTYKAANEMSHRCCDMTDYYASDPSIFSNSDDYASSSTCTAPANPTSGSYSGTCATGSTLLSGNTCVPTCDSGFSVSGTTRCVGGTITETATCVASTCDGRTSAVPAPTNADSVEVAGTASARTATEALDSTLIFTCSTGFTSTVTYTCGQSGAFATTDSCVAVPEPEPTLEPEPEPTPEPAVETKVASAAFTSATSAALGLVATGFAMIV